MAPGFIVLHPFQVPARTFDFPEIGRLEVDGEAADKRTDVMRIVAGHAWFQQRSLSYIVSHCAHLAGTRKSLVL